MLIIHLKGGRNVQRVFAGNICSEADITKFTNEVRKELNEGSIVFCEVWKDIENVRKRIEVPTKEQEMLATERKT